MDHRRSSAKSKNDESTGFVIPPRVYKISLAHVKVNGSEISVLKNVL
jgi:hypothetical protein